MTTPHNPSTQSSTDHSTPATSPPGAGMGLGPDLHESPPPTSSSAAATPAVGNTRLCVYCHTEKAWIFSGDRAKDGSKIYIDENKHRWAGKRCPQCERKRTRAANRHDSFERASVITTLKAQGYTVTNAASPMQVEKQGQSYSVGIRRAFMDGDGNIVVENSTEASEDATLTALLFQTTKIVNEDQLQALKHRLRTHSPS